MCPWQGLVINEYTICVCDCCAVYLQWNPSTVVGDGKSPYLTIEIRSPRQTHCYSLMTIVFEEGRGKLEEQRSSFLVQAPAELKAPRDGKASVGFFNR